MFTTPCYIRKNTPELRKKLEELGYEPNYRISIYPDVYRNIAACNFFGNRYYGVSDKEASQPGNIEDAIKNKGMIDCGTNEELFLALAALRDDTNANQWLTDGKIWGKFDEDSFLHPIQIINYLQSKGHKASIEEIIEHFKDK